MLNKRGIGGLGKLIWFAVIILLIVFFEFTFAESIGWTAWLSIPAHIIINGFLLVVGLIYLFSKGEGFGAGKAFSIFLGIVCLVLALFGSMTFFGTFVLEIPILGQLLMNSFLVNIFGIGSWVRIIIIAILLLYFIFADKSKKTP